MTPLRTATLVASLLLALLAGTGAARAGTYVINNCYQAQSGNNNAGSWTPFGGQTVHASCANGGWVGAVGTSLAPEAAAGAAISAPTGSGITIEQARLWWYVARAPQGAPISAIVQTNAGEVATNTTPLSQSGSTYQLPSTTTSLTLEAYCTGTAGENGCSYEGNQEMIELHGAQLTLSDNSLPSAIVTGGQLAGNATVAGTQALAFNGYDGASGIRLAQLLVDGQVVATDDYTAQCPYQNFAACPTTVSDTVSFDTTAFPNGVHDIALQITSAAGDTAVVDDHELTVQNPPNTPNGSPACNAARLSLAVNGKSNRRLIRYGHLALVTGTLACDTTPISDATIDITGGGLNAHIPTSMSGAFSFLVPRGPSRRLSFTYRAFADSPRLAATATATVDVLPHIELAIHPRRTFNGGTINWSGRVLGGPYPRGGVTLLIEVREGRRWQPFDQIIARGGRFRYRYTFLRTTQPIDYLFRVALPANGAGGYDYAPGGSNIVRVHVA
jgi:hypothetical protein